ncbi:GtrA family protein [Ciceribacter sichuanensis]|nr:GtrA family protein [Ciceribacter sp. S153]
MRAEFFRYLSVGFLNTSVGLTLIYAAMYFGAGDLLANFIGYSVGFVISYSANSIWTFRERPSKMTAVKYFCLMGICYATNIAVMTFTRDILNFSSYLAQFCGVCAYTVCSYLGARFYVFSR